MRILKLELKKMLKAKLTLCAVALILLFTVLLAYLPTVYCYSNGTDEEGNVVSLTGLASIAYEKERQAGAAGAVTPERVRVAVEAYQDCLKRYSVTESYDLPEEVYEREILPFAPLLHGVKEAFADADTGMAPSLMEVEPEQIDGYFAVCEARIEALMKLEQPDNPAAQRRAVEMYRKVEKPFAVYPGITSNVMDYQNMAGFLVLLLCMAIAAQVFSADYQSGADDILRCTKYGSRQLGVAKAAAALSISGGVFLICSVIYILTVNSLFGWDCVRTSVQMVYSIVTLIGMDLGQLQCFFAFAGLLSVLAAVCFALFLSSRCRNTVTALAVSLAFCAAPMVVSLTMPGKAAAWICSLLPTGGVSIQASILYAVTDFQFLNLFGMPVWMPYAMVGAYLIEIPLFFCLAVRSYCTHTVNG